MNGMRQSSPHCALLCLALLPAALVAQEFARIPAGSLAVTDGLTQLPVTIHRGAFDIGRDEITQAEFQRVMAANPAHHRGSQRPVENVSFEAALDYCNRRSLLEGLTPCYDGAGAWDRSCSGYRLPTEAEWIAAAGPPATLVEGAHLAPGPLNVDELTERVSSLGTRLVGQGRASAAGVRDLLGNVWEWTWDRFNTVAFVDSVYDPAGPQTGHERVIRGGSYLSAAKAWNKGFRSSMPPAARSPFVGFRIARTVARATPATRLKAVGSMQTVHSESGALKPDQPALARRWLEVLGQPKIGVEPVTVRLVETILEPTWTGRLLELSAESGLPWRAMLVLPAHLTTARKLPVVIVPFYDVDSPAGKNLGGRNFTPPGVRALAVLAAQRGMAALAVRWSGENDGPGYQEVVAGLAIRHPGVTGLGYWVWQSRRLTDWLSEQPEIDPARIGIAGHSLGGKMALYAAAFEPRIQAVVASEPGISLSFSNYSDPWYFGPRIKLLAEGADQDDLLALIAPRPFLLVAGEDSDGDKSLSVLRRAARAYESLGAPGSLFFLNHRTGHSPTPESVVSAMEWLEGALRR